MRLSVLTGIVILAALSRIVPHPPNVTPVAALALFAGAYLPNRKLAYVLTLAAMLLSDVVLSVLVYGRLGLTTQFVVYACMLATVILGGWIRNKRSAFHVASVTFASSVLFYVVTNFAVWAGGHLYAHTWAGLIACYIAAVPFFRNSVAGDLAFAALLFGGFVVLETHFVSIREGRRLRTA